MYLMGFFLFAMRHSIPWNTGDAVGDKSWCTVGFQCANCTKITDAGPALLA